jgi:hypothetical protein
MTLEQAKDFTLHRIIFGDMLLNWLLGVILLLVPGLADQLIGRSPMLPDWVYRVIGIGFIGFAAWQTWIVRKDEINPPSLIFAALLAEGPVVLLTAALVFGNFPLYLLPKILLWIGNIYMLVLGVWYFYLARWVVARSATA